MGLPWRIARCTWLVLKELAPDVIGALISMTVASHVDQQQSAHWAVQPKSILPSSPKGQTPATRTPESGASKSSSFQGMSAAQINHKLKESGDSMAGGITKSRREAYWQGRNDQKRIDVKKKRD